MKKLILPIFLTVIGGFNLYYIVVFNSPFQENNQFNLFMLGYFFLAFLVILACVFTLLLYLASLIIRKIFKLDCSTQTIRNNFRQGTIIGLVLVLIAVLRLTRLDNLLNLVLLILISALFESLFWNKDKKGFHK